MHRSYLRKIAYFITMAALLIQLPAINVNGKEQIEWVVTGNYSLDLLNNNSILVEGNFNSVQLIKDTLERPVIIYTTSGYRNNMERETNFHFRRYVNNQWYTINDTRITDKKLDDIFLTLVDLWDEDIDRSEPSIQAIFNKNNDVNILISYFIQDISFNPEDPSTHTNMNEYIFLTHKNNEWWSYNSKLINHVYYTNKNNYKALLINQGTLLSRPPVLLLNKNEKPILISVGSQNIDCLCLHDGIWLQTFDNNDTNYKSFNLGDESKWIYEYSVRMNERRDIFVCMEIHDSRDRELTPQFQWKSQDIDLLFVQLIDGRWCTIEGKPYIDYTHGGITPFKFEDLIDFHVNNDGKLFIATQLTDPTTNSRFNGDVITWDNKKWSFTNGETLSKTPVLNPFPIHVFNDQFGKSGDLIWHDDGSIDIFWLSKKMNHIRYKQGECYNLKGKLIGLKDNSCNSEFESPITSELPYTTFNFSTLHTKDAVSFVFVSHRPQNTYHLPTIDDFNFEKVNGWPNWNQEPIYSLLNFVTSSTGTIKTRDDDILDNEIAYLSINIRGVNSQFINVFNPDQSYMFEARAFNNQDRFIGNPEVKWFIHYKDWQKDSMYDIGYIDASGTYNSSSNSNHSGYIVCENNGKYALLYVYVKHTYGYQVEPSFVELERGESVDFDLLYKHGYDSIYEDYSYVTADIEPKNLGTLDGSIFTLSNDPKGPIDGQVIFSIGLCEKKQSVSAIIKLKNSHGSDKEITQSNIIKPLTFENGTTVDIGQYYLSFEILVPDDDVEKVFVSSFILSKEKNNTWGSIFNIVDGRNDLRLAIHTKRGNTHYFMYTLIGNDPKKGSSKSIVIFPQICEVTRNQIVSFQAVFYDQYGKIVENKKPISWSVSDSSIGSISTDGIFTASDLENASGYVIISDGVLDSRLLIKIIKLKDTPTATLSGVFPKVARIPSGGSISFIPVDQFGNKYDNYDLKWSVVPSEFGFVSSDGLFVNNTECNETKGYIIITKDNKQYYSTIEIINSLPSVSSITINPYIESLSLGNVIKFVVIGYDKSNKHVPIEEKHIKWSISNAVVGSITKDGVFTCLSKGHCQVIATYKDSVFNSLNIKVE